MKKKNIYPLNLTLSLVIIAFFGLILIPIRSWGQISNLSFSPSLVYNQPNFQYNYSFSPLSQNIYSYSYGSTLSGLRSFSSLPTSFFSPASTNLSFPSLTPYFSFNGSGIDFYPPSGISGFNFPAMPFVSPPLIFSPSSVGSLTSIYLPRLFSPPIVAPTFQFPSTIWPGPFPTPFPSQPTPQPTPQSTQKKLFQREYTNYALGYYHSGFYITEEGKVYTFKNRGSSEQQGDEIKFAYTFDPSVLEEKRSLILQARQGPYSGRTAGATDVGTIIYSAFLENTEILLRESGTSLQENLSPAAKDLVSWLENIYLELHAEERSKLFQVEFTNFSWEYQHSGFFIDREEYLFSFQNKGNSPDEGDTIKVIRRIPHDIINEKNNLIVEASKGTYSERTQAAYDTGSKVYSAFLGNDEILLLETGDYTQENLSSQAQELVLWLKEIESEISQ